MRIHLSATLLWSILIFLVQMQATSAKPALFRHNSVVKQVPAETESNEGPLLESHVHELAGIGAPSLMTRAIRKSGSQKQRSANNHPKPATGKVYTTSHTGIQKRAQAPHPPNPPTAHPKTQVAHLKTQTASLQNHTTSLKNQTAHLQNQTAPLQNKTGTLQNKTAPLQNKTAPLQNQTAPLQNQTAPPQNQTAPPQNQTAPPQNQTAPLQTHTENLGNQTAQVDNQTDSNTTTPDPPTNYTQKMVIPKKEHEDSYEEHYRNRENEILKLVELYGFGHTVDILAGRLEIQNKKPLKEEERQQIRESVITAVTDYHLSIKSSSPAPTSKPDDGSGQMQVILTTTPYPPETNKQQNASTAPENKENSTNSENSKISVNPDDYPPAKVEQRQATAHLTSTTTHRTPHGVTTTPPAAHPSPTTHALPQTTSPHHTTQGPPHLTTADSETMESSNLVTTKESAKHEPPPSKSEHTTTPNPKKPTTKQATSQTKPPPHAQPTKKPPTNIKAKPTALPSVPTTTNHTTRAPVTIKTKPTSRTSVTIKPTTHAPLAKEKSVTKPTNPPSTTTTTTTTMATTQSPATSSSTPANQLLLKQSPPAVFFPVSAETQSPHWNEPPDYTRLDDVKDYDDLDSSEDNLYFPNSTEAELLEYNDAAGNSSPEATQYGAGAQLYDPNELKEISLIVLNISSTPTTSKPPTSLKNETNKKTNRCPTFDGFLSTASKLWERLLETTGFTNSIDLVVEAWVQSLKALGSCFLSIAGDIYAYFSGLLRSENNSSGTETGHGNGTSR